MAGPSGPRTGRSYGCRWSASGTLVNHLATCEYQPEHVQSQALRDPACTLSTRVSRVRAQAIGFPIHMQAHILPSQQPSSLFQSSEATGGSPGSHGLGMNWLLGPDILSPLPPNIDLSSSLPATPGSSVFGQLRPEDSVSAIASGSSSPQPQILPPSILSRTSSLSRRPSGMPSGLGRSASGGGWSTARQELFENLLARLTASANLPFSWVDNPVWQTFCDEFIPAAKLPSRKVLTTRIIPRLVTELRDAAKAEAKGKNVTVQADGWTGENHHHLIAFMITAEKKVHTQLNKKIAVIHVYY